MNEQTEEKETARYGSNWVSYETITSNARGQPRERILGRLEGFMQSGIIVSNDDLQRILEEQRFSVQETNEIGQAQMKGIRKGLDLGYNDTEEYWDAHAERLRNLPVILEYKSRRSEDESK